MITAVEIRKKTERKYVDYLRSVVAGSEFEPIVIPCDKKASASMDEYQRELNGHPFAIERGEGLWLHD